MTRLMDAAKKRKGPPTVKRKGPPPSPLRHRNELNNNNVMEIFEYVKQQIEEQEEQEERATIYARVCKGIEFCRYIRSRDQKRSREHHAKHPIKPFWTD